ncbi:putative general amidase [Aspergillus saccharolyticus JOP 1030-1]|uniref:Fatty-acid amide hydrolase n=1 Tax=Aspergillus saccharolyticus JOP 1030-1 TaxID=1450539 RepID=A0A318ZMI0_9EURO|nr:fatty-acid amide hydrolase [Aspergillus saccharolyticus JOP 1030-1]PYH45643.1 fatty-acid amide hydrolase [Aspergillus saccharolyticus JOP 1030-1]
MSYKNIAHQKQLQLEAQIPPQWRLNASQIPPGLLSPADSITNTGQYEAINVLEIPRICGLLTPEELHITEQYDIRSLLDAIRERKFTSKEVVEAFCKVNDLVPCSHLPVSLTSHSQRAAIAQQLTRCLTEPVFEQALRQAQKLDDHLQRTGAPIGPLHGLPVSVKDSFHLAGVDSTTGLAALASRPAAHSSPLVHLLTSLGAIIIAKTNVPQTMAALDSCNHLFGRTLNPLNRRLTVGGSTGGEAALLAMRGSMVGFGTDIGGSIRIPAMCTGLYGFKPSAGRVPIAGTQDAGSMAGKGRVSLQPVAGPLARSVADLGTVMAEIVPRAELFSEDGIPGVWSGSRISYAPSVRGGAAGVTQPPSFGERQVLTIGVLRGDGLVEPLPPIAKVLDEVAQLLRHTPGVRVVEVPVPPALSKCQGIAGRLMGVDGANPMMDLLEATEEPLIPWLRGRMKRGRELTLAQVGALQAQRAQLEREMLAMWRTRSTTATAGWARDIDAIIHPVAPHPVPELDRYNAVGYTSSWVLLDYPAGTIPVRAFREDDLELGKEMTAPVLGSWDKANRLLWNQKTVDRRVYLGSPLSVQVITPTQHDYELYQAMELIDRAVRGEARVSAML